MDFMQPPVINSHSHEDSPLKAYIKVGYDDSENSNIFHLFNIDPGTIHPFLYLGAFFPVKGLPFGLPISFLMIFIPFLLSLIHAFNSCRIKGIAGLFASIFDFKKASLRASIFCLLCMPLVVLLTYFTMKARLCRCLLKSSSPLRRAHPPGRIAGMLILNVLMRIAMVYAYTYGGSSLFSALIFHTMINVSIGLFPNGGSHVNTWILSAWMGIVLLLAVRSINKTKG